MATASAPLAMTMGDPAGVGPELTLRAWALCQKRCENHFFVIGSTAHLRTLSQSLGLDIPIGAISAPEESVDLFQSVLPVIELALSEEVIPGQPNTAHAPQILKSIERAVEFALAGKACGVVTNPIHKSSLKQAGFNFPGAHGIPGSFMSRSDG